MTEKWKKNDKNVARVNVDALIQDPKSENHEYFKESLNFLMDEHIHWRRDFHQDDKPVISLGEQHEFMDFDVLKQKLHDQGALHKDIDWPSRDVYEAYKAMGKADSITLDLHKRGYVPYAAGGVVLIDKRAIDLISYFAAYVFEKSEGLRAVLL